MGRSKATFEKALENLEKTVEELETGDLTLDDSLARYEQGVKALKTCYEILRDAEKRVEILLQGEEGTATFETGDGQDSATDTTPEE